MANTVTFSGSVFSSDATDQWELARIAPAIPNVDTIVQRQRAKVADAEVQTIGFGDFASDQATILMFFLLSGTITVAFKDSAANQCTFVNPKLIVILSGITTELVITGGDPDLVGATENIYEIILGA